MKIKTKNVTNEDYEEIQEYIDRTPKNKKKMNRNPINDFINSYSVRDFTCKSENQKKIIKSICNKDTIITVVHGQAGTGKTFSAIQGMLKQFKSAHKVGESYNKIYLLKSVKTLDNKSEDIGFLKGTMEEKVAPFMFSYDFNFTQIVDKVAYGVARESQLIEFLPLAYIRGIGLSDCIIILDEAQNINNSILRTVLSRIGKNCKLIILGDTRQKDSSNGQTSGLNLMVKHFENIKGIEFIKMGPEDQSRAEIINVIEDKYDDLENQGINVS
tara:strand:+ start:497 stop:1309 length:813 start_codon:yes stop_codon:yes gene_type:complete